MPPRPPRDLAMFNLAIDSKLCGCDLVDLRVDDGAVGSVLCPTRRSPALVDADDLIQ
jgi:hypothetical protein